MFMHRFFERMGTTNNLWPEGAIVLSAPAMLSGPKGDYQNIGPCTLQDWVSSQFRALDHSSNFTAQLDWWTVYNTIYRWEAKYPEKYLAITHPNDFTKVALWNERIVLRYNTVWAFFGYTDNQDPLAIKYADYLTSEHGCKELEESRGPVDTHVNQYGVYTDNPSKPKKPKPSYGKEKTKQPLFIKRIVQKPIKKT